MKKALITVLFAAILAGPYLPGGEKPAVRYANDLRQARTAARNRDYPVALAAYERLLGLSPYHPGLYYQIARLRALTGQVPDALNALEKALLLGYDFGEKLDDALQALLPGASSARLKTLIETMRRPVTASRVAFTIPERDLTPEGIVHDPRDGSFYLGSTWKHKIVRIDALGRRSDFTTEGQDGLRSVLGLRIDDARRTLWAVSAASARIPSNDPGENGASAVFRYSLADGRLTGKYELREAGAAHLLNDLTLSPGGDVFVTDTESGSVYTIPAGGKTLRLFIGPELLINPNGIAMDSSGKAFYVACGDGIHRVDIARRTTRRLKQPDDVCLGGIDGLYRLGGGLLGIQNGNGLNRIVRIDLNPRGEAAERLIVLENRNPDFELPTTGALAGKTLYYMANTQIYSTDETGRLLPPEKLRDIIVLRLDLDSSPAAAHASGEIRATLDRMEETWNAKAAAAAPEGQVRALLVRERKGRQIAKPDDSDHEVP